MNTGSSIPALSVSYHQSETENDIDNHDTGSNTSKNLRINNGNSAASGCDCERDLQCHSDVGCSSHSQSDSNVADVKCSRGGLSHQADSVPRGTVIDAPSEQPEPMVLKAVSPPSLWELPREDIVFAHILSLLDIKALVSLSITCVDLQHLVHEFLKRKKDLDMRNYGPRISPEALGKLLVKLESCQSLNLKGCKFSLTDQILEAALSNNQLVLHLDLTGCISLTNRSLQAVAINCSKLAYLSLHDCSWVSAEAVANIALHCRKILHVSLSGCWNVTDATVSTIAVSCPRLQSLIVSRIYGITDRSVVQLARTSARLRYLNVQDCWRLTNYSMEQLLEYSKNLKVLHIKGCRSVTWDVLKKLRTRGVALDCPTPPQPFVALSQPPVQI